MNNTDTKRFEIPRKACIGVSAIFALSTVSGSATGDIVKAACAGCILIIALVGIYYQFKSETTLKQQENSNDGT